nr:MAG TPA: hypothetical protein [Bacteriophage sp.]
MIYCNACVHFRRVLGQIFCSRYQVELKQGAVACMNYR